LNYLFTAIMTKTVGSSLSSSVGGRIFLDYAQEGTEYPYIVFFIVAGNPNRTFTERFTETLIQFSIYSASPGAAEITGIYNNLKALFDECLMTITGSTLVWIKEQSLMTMVDEVEVIPDTTTQIRHWACDYEVLTSLN